MKHSIRCLVLSLLAATCVGCGGAEREQVDAVHDTPATGAGRAQPGHDDYLFVWSADADHEHDDFLAVVDVDESSPTFAQVIATAPVGAKFTIPHHTEHELDRGGELFANGFKSQDTFVFDLRDSRNPRVVTSFKPPAPWRRPHSFVRLPNDNVLVTLQSSGEDEKGPGALMEVTARGDVVRIAEARDDAVDPHILPYSAVVVPALDRVVTTSADMHERFVSQVVQVWKLPGLERVRTVPLPPGPNGKEGWDPAEPRVLGDGRTVLVSTFNCGLYELTGLDGDAPAARFVHGFDGGGCALPLVVGNYWVQTVPDAHALVALDVADPSNPREADRLVLGEEFEPHWIAGEPLGTRIVLSTDGPRVLLVSIDLDTGGLSLIEAFRDVGAGVAGVSFDRSAWPHGASGKALPHGAVFSRP